MKKTLFTLITLINFACAVYAQPGSNDPTFNSSDICPTTTTGFNDAINSISIQTDGKIIVGGLYTLHNGVTKNRIVRLNNDGTIDASFITGSGFNGLVNTTSIQSDGKIIVGGGFTTYNGTSTFTQFITRLNSNGTIDPTFNIGTGFNFDVKFTVIQPDGKIIVGGVFTSFNGTARYRIARLNTNGSLDATFNPAGTGISSSVIAAAIQTDGKIIIGGAFTIFNGIIINKIVRLNSNGTIDATFNPGSGFDAQVNSISIQSDGKIIVGGIFTTYNGVTSNKIVRLNTDGSLDNTFNSGTGFNSGVISTAIQPDGKIVIGGSFTNFNGTVINRIARLNSNGSIDQNFITLSGANNIVNTIALQQDGKIIVGGHFTTYDGLPRIKITRLNPSGFNDSSFSPVTGFNGKVNSSAIQPDGKIIFGGEFTISNDILRNKISRLNIDGTIDQTFNPGLGFNNNVYTTAIQSDGKIIVGGIFTTFNGIIRKNIVRLNSNGILDTTFNTGFGFDTTVNTISIQADGKIIVGGIFTSYNGASINKIARLNIDGTLDTSFAPGTLINGFVSAVAIQTDGKIIVGGGFVYLISGNAVSRITRLNTNGSLDLSFTSGTGFNERVNSIVIQSNGKIIVGGVFTTYNGSNRNGIARLNTNGTIDATFNPGSGFSIAPGVTGVYKVAIQSQSNGKIIVGGSFTTFNGTGRNRIACLNSNGTLDATFNPGTGFNDLVSSIAIQNNGQIIVGGNFTNYNGVCRARIARLNVSCLNTFSTNNINSCGSYTWIDGINYTSNNNSATYIMPNSNGCDSIITLNLIINSTPLPIGDTVQTFCDIATISDLILSGSNIVWYNSINGGAPLSSSTTLVNGATYYATQTINNCQSNNRLPVKVTINSPQPTGLPAQTFCNTATISDLIANGTNIQWYAYNNGGTPLSFSTALVNGLTYYASQTINNCESVTRFEVLVNIDSSAGPTGTNSQTFCNGAIVSDLIVLGSNIQWYSSSNAGTPLSFSTILVNGTTYYASQTTNNCESLSRLPVTVNINQNPTITNTINTTIACGSATASLIPASSVTGTAFNWVTQSSGATLTGYTTTGTGAINQVINNSGNVPGTVVYVITPTANGCIGTPANYSVTVNPIPNANFSIISNTLCINQSPVSLTPALSGGVFSGTGVSQNTFNPAVSGVGTFTVSYLVSQNNCTNSSTQTITVNAIDNANFSINAFCFGNAGQATISGVQGGTFSLIPNTNGETISSIGTIGSGVAGTTYTVTYTTPASSCQNSSTDVVTIFALPNAPDVNLVNDTLRTTAIAASYLWYYNGTTTGVTTSYYEPGTAIGNYQIEITDANGCSSISQNYLYQITSLNQIINDNTSHVKIYPNPANNQLYVETDNSTDISFKLIDVLGKEIMLLDAQQIKQKNIKLILDIEFVQPSIYFYEIISDAKIIDKGKIIIQK
jgi:uncharacterized delta-60 repeat protein